MTYIYAFVFFMLGLAATALFYGHVFMPIWASVTVFVAVSVCLLWQFGRKRVGGLMLLLWLVYALPFIHLVPYLWFDFGYAHPDNLWGLAVNPYMLDKTTVTLMAMIGAVGACGFATGALAHARKLPEANELGMEPAGRSALSLPVFAVWVAVGVACTWLAAPQATIFTAVYTQSTSLSQGWDFSSLWMVSYAFIIFAFADAMLDKLPGRRKMKFRLVLAALLVIVVWFQLLRGDRESLTMVVAVVLMYYLWGAGVNGAKPWRKVEMNWKRIGAFVFLVFAVSFFTGYFRSAMTSVGSVDQFVDRVSSMHFDHFISGTWSAVLLGPLSVAGDYLRGKLTIQHGQTYLDLLASTMPGFVADWIGYVRPYSSLHNPAWNMTYGIGGTHAVVVPFMNFTMAGVFVIIALWSYVLAGVERYALRRFTQSNLALLGIIAMASAHWLWYGEKNIMNALILWLLLSILYRMRIFPQPASKQAAAGIAESSI